MTELNNPSASALNQHIHQCLQFLEKVIPKAEHKYIWALPSRLEVLMQQLQKSLSNEFVVANGIAVHRTARVEAGAVLKAPVIIGANSFIAHGAYLRGAVLVGESVTIGPGSEVKTSILLENSCLAHFNFVGDSLIGSRVNFEAGAVCANHWNEREDKRIVLRHNNYSVDTGLTKFGSIVGDGSKIGANAVLSPGTLLSSGTIVERLSLVNQAHCLEPEAGGG